MGIKTFRGGIHPNENKQMSAGRILTPCIPRGDLVYFLDQHIGKPAAAVVKKGDTVQVGQLIAKADGFVSANIVSSCSGTVKAVEFRAGADGTVRPCIVISSDGVFSQIPGMGIPCDAEDLSNQQILDKIRDAGIVGMGGAGFPTHVKLAPREPEKIDTIIVNGAECEPYITCDDLLMQDRPEEIVMALQLLLRLFPNAKGVSAIEKNKPAAIAAMRKAALMDGRISVEPLKVKYPQGGERNLIYAVTGRRLPAGKLPAEYGCVVDNVATLAAIYRAVYYNEPLTERLFTVSGDAVENPGNYVVKIGTPISQIVETAGGFSQEPKKILLGGPMMGIAITDPEGPVCKNNNALICFTVDPVAEAARVATNCIRCGLCVRTCPEGLVPQRMALAVERGNYAEFEKIYGMQCVQCGSCAYVCPARRPLTQLFKQGKAAVLAERAKGAKKA